jgi:citrate lyase subunit beta/citryl-CoA lyase
MAAMSSATLLTGLAEDMEAGRQRALQKRALAHADLPLRWLRQQAHFTTPASDRTLATKAVEGGLSSAARFFDKLGISASRLGEALDVPTEDVQRLMADPAARSPLVMLDGEDAQALRDDVVLRGRENAVQLLRDGRWGSTLRFYRPSGIELPYCIQDLLTVLSRAGEGRSAEEYPLDGIVWPKVEQPDELEWVSDGLAAIERRLGLPTDRIRLAFLVESGWGLANLPALVKYCAPRLCSVIFGITDYAADLGLLEAPNDHPAADAARRMIVNAAGAAGVPAIDSMTVAYPVTDKSLSEAANRDRILQRVRECYEDARHGIALGMSGKWVGHPAQLFAVLLAFQRAIPAERIEAELCSVEAYSAAVAQERGTTIIGGVMTDRANDRHSRALLRKAVVWGALDPERAVRAGVISEKERAELGLPG